jgi:hypothetical protein
MTAPLIEEGAWKARCCAWDMGTTQSTGNEQVGLDFVILEGPNTGSHITWYGYFTDDTWERTVESLRLCGWGGSDLSDLSGVDSNEVRIVIEHEADLQGEYRARVKWVNNLGGVAMKNRMDVGAQKAFAQKMRGRIIALGAKGPAPRPQTQQTPRPAQRPTGAAVPPVQQPVMPNQSDDDIPF